MKNYLYWNLKWGVIDQGKSSLKALPNLSISVRIFETKFKCSIHDYLSYEHQMRKDMPLMRTKNGFNFSHLIVFSFGIGCSYGR